MHMKQWGGGGGGGGGVDAGLVLSKRGERKAENGMSTAWRRTATARTRYALKSEYSCLYRRGGGGGG